MLDVVLRPRTQLNLESIYIHIAVALSSPKAAGNTISKIYASIGRIAEPPDLGDVLEGDGVDRPYRRMLCERYWIYCTHDTKMFTIWRAFHTRQDIDDCTYVDL